MAEGQDQDDSKMEEDEWVYYDDDDVLCDFWQYFVSEERNFTEPVDIWRRHFTKPFVDQLSEIEEERLNTILLKPLEQFICGSEDVEEVWARLRQADTPADVCGKVFKSGETCYNCKDCGQDATCVLCVDCFTHSEHKNHRYRMSTSEGGGYCDCGDSEAFKSFPRCKLHEPEGGNKESPSEVLGRFPEELRERARDVLYSICKYCLDVVSEPKLQTDLISGLKEKELFPDLKFPLQYSNYCCVLLNDENHSYNDVIRVLKKVLPKPTSKLATDLTTFVDKYGKAVIRVGSYSECSKTSSQIESLTRLNSSIVLKSKVLPTYIVAHQEFVPRLLSWIPSLFKVSSGFRALFAEVMFMRSQQTNIMLKKPHATNKAMTISQAVLLNDFNSWKQVRNLWLELIIDGLMKDYESKRKLSVVFAENYPEIVEDYYCDDQERDSSIMVLSVQMFTVPSLAHYLIENCDAMSKMLQGFITLLNENKDENGTLDLNAWLVEEKSEFQRGLMSLYDLTYLLSVVPSTEMWSDALRNNFKNGAVKVLEILTMMQGMDKMRRQTGQHVEMEDNGWKLTYELQHHFGEIVRLVTSWAVADKSVMLQLLEETLRLITFKHDPSSLKEKSKYLAFLGPPKIYEFIDFDVTLEKISLNVPLHRFLISLMVESPRYGIETTLLQRINNSISPLQLLEPVLQTLVTVAQISIGMWKRNGTSAESQAFLYSSKKYCPGIKDSDLLMMQMVASLTDDIDTFLVTVLARFKLTKWANGDLETEPKARSQEFVEHCNGLADQWLGLMIGVTGERFSPWVGAGVDQRAALEQELIQLLCTEPMPHSQIIKRFPERKNEKELDSVLKEIATLESCKKTVGKKVYRLKEGLEERYNMFYYGYTKEQQTQAQEYQLESRSKAGEGKDCCPPPRMPKLTRMMSGLVRILQSKVILQTALVTLRRATDSSPEQRLYVTERQVHKVLYLVALGIQENAVETEHSKFLKVAHDCGLFEAVGRLLQDSNNVLVPPHIRKLASWILNNGGHREDSAMETDDGYQAGEGEKEKQAKKRAEAAAARRAKILANMNKAQRNFAAENKAALANLKDEKSAQDPVTNQCSQDRETVCLGPGMTSRQDSSKLYTCILCREESSDDGQATMVLAAFIQKSTVLSQAGSLMEEADDYRPEVSPHHLPVTRDCAPHLSSCGHAMHATCYQKFFQSLEAKERERINSFGFNRIQNFDVTAGEFLCPICERLSNTVLPLFPSVNSLRKKQPSAPVAEISFNSFINGLRSSVESWYLKEDRENGPALPRMALKSSLEEQAQLQGPDFLQYFRQHFHNSNAENGESGMFEEIMTSMMNVFSLSTFTSSLELDPYEEDYRVPLLSLQCVAYTLVSLERMLWNEEKALFGGLNPREEDTVRNITRYITLFPSSYTKPQRSINMRDLVKKMKNFVKLQFLQSNAMFILSTLLCKVTPDGTDPLTLDAFGVLVSLVVSLPCLFNSETPPKLPSGQATEIHCLKLCLLLHIVQVVSSFKVEDLSDLVETRGRTDENKTFDILASVWRKNGIKVDSSRLSISKLYSKLERLVLPYLRCCALMFQHFTDVFPGKVLVNDGGLSYQPLAKYLGLPPSLKQFLDNPASSLIITSLLEKEVRQPKVSQLKFPLNFRRAKPHQTKLFYPLAHLAGDHRWSGGLIPLPRDYTDLMNLAASFSCGNSLTGESKTPVVCLVCGMMVCSYSHCCETTISSLRCGGCTTHARQCAAGTGIFLRVRECFIVIHNKLSRGAYLPAPYVDEYGETDKGLKRGNPLFLDEEKYSELNRMWLRNEVPEKIARSFDPDVLLYIEWNQF